MGDIFEKNQTNEESINENNSIWKKFEYDIKYKNRFFVNNNVLEILEKLTKYSEVTPLGFTKVYRARIGDFIKKDDTGVRFPM